ncbi:MAG: hypothetical protein PHV39_08320 [Methanomicrobium sp.]|nr:hypothetical protein [Methanomicrobium sp.]
MREVKDTRSQGLIFKKQVILGQINRAGMDWNALERSQLENFGHLQAEEAEHAQHAGQSAKRRRKRLQEKRKTPLYWLLKKAD